MSRIAKALVVTAAAGMAVTGAAGVASADADATGAAIGSPGFLSGNVVQLPINIPIIACGNSIGLVSILNPTFGNTCINGDFEHEHREQHKFQEHHEHHEHGEHHDED